MFGDTILWPKQACRFCAGRAVSQQRGKKQRRIVVDGRKLSAHEKADTAARMNKTMPASSALSTTVRTLIGALGLAQRNEAALRIRKMHNDSVESWELRVLRRG